MKKLFILFCVLIMTFPVAVYADNEGETGIILDQEIMEDPTEKITEETKEVIEESIEETRHIEITEPQEVIVKEDYTLQEVSDTIPMRPLNLKYNNVTKNSVSIVWDDNTGYDKVTSYNVYVNGNKVGNTKVSEYTIINLLPGRTYEITVTAINYYGESLESEPITVTTKKLQGVAPTNLRLNNVTENSAFISWEGEGLYNVYLNGNFIGTTPKNNYQFNNLNENDIYEITIESYNDTNLYETVQIKTGQAIQQEDVLEIINAGFDYISAMWPYTAVIAGLIIAFAIASMILGLFENGVI